MKYLVFTILIGLVIIGYSACGTDKPKPQPTEQPKPDSTKVAEGEQKIDAETGLVIAEGWKLVKQNCLSCHTSDLIVQNRATSAGWLATIRWMQEKQGLWDLGENEKPILAYLSANYAPNASGRRPPLNNIEWYVLGEENAPTTTTTVKKDVPPRSGIEVFTDYCVACHGATGTAQKNGAKDLSKSKLDLKGIVKMVTKGSENGKMISYEGMLKKEEIENVAKFVQKLQK